MASLSERAVPGKGEKLGTVGLREATVHLLHFTWAMPFISHHRDCISVAANLRTGSRQRLMRNLNPPWNVGRFWGFQLQKKPSRSQKPRSPGVDIRVLAKDG